MNFHRFLSDLHKIWLNIVEWSMLRFPICDQHFNTGNARYNWVKVTSTYTESKCNEGNEGSMRIGKIEIRAPLIATRLKVAAGIPLLYASQPVPLACSCIWRKPLSYRPKFTLKTRGWAQTHAWISVVFYLTPPNLASI